MYWKLRSILNSRGIQTPPAGSLSVEDVGAGPFIATWNIAALGARPTQLEIDAVQDTDATALQQSQRAAGALLNKDVVATIAWSIRFKDPAAWNAMTLPEKKAAVQAEYPNWKTIRIFVETIP
jgi:hypothetical protein